MRHTTITADLIIADVFTQWPGTMTVFIKRKMSSCIGCPMASLMTLADAIKVHNLSAEPFLQELNIAARERPATDKKPENN